MPDTISHADTAEFKPRPGTALLGTAGWALTRETAHCFAGEGTQLQRYASAFSAVEINSSFYRPHKPDTYARWAASVPADFRFAVKLPRAISHYARLDQADQPLARFATQANALGDKLGCVLAQFPPSGQFDAKVAEQFFQRLRQAFPACMLACEGRHASWFGPEATALLREQGITRVQADPPQGQDGEFEATTEAAYVRLHGSPRIYYSSYADELLQQQAQALAQRAQVGLATWLIFDNTASGAAQRNALAVRGRWPCAGRPAGEPLPELAEQD